MSSRAERMHRTGKLDDSCAKVTSHVADGCVTGRDQTLLPPPGLAHRFATPALELT